MHNYVQTAVPDYASALSFEITGGEMTEKFCFPDQKVKRFADGDESRISFSDELEITANVPFAYLSDSDGQAFLDYYCDEAKADGIKNSWPLVHPKDGYTYVVLFEDEFEREQVLTHFKIHGVNLKVIGKLA